MTFAQMLHRSLDHYFGDEAFARRDMRQIEKIKAQLLDEVFEEAWREVPEELRLRISADGKDRIPTTHNGQETADNEEHRCHSRLNPCCPDGQNSTPS